MRRQLGKLYQYGLRPYIATSADFLEKLSTHNLDAEPHLALLEDESSSIFHNDYLTANAAGFGNPHLKTPDWVYVNCVLMQTFVSGFCIDAHRCPQAVLELFNLTSENVAQPRLLPISGYTTCPSIGGSDVFDISLFSLRRFFPSDSLPVLAGPSKALGLLALEKLNIQSVSGITQYNNASIPIHASFCDHFEIYRPRVTLHPLGTMSFIYRGALRRDWMTASDAQDAAFDFLLDPSDETAKRTMAEKHEAGARFHIVAPYLRKDHGRVGLPIRVTGAAPDAAQTLRGGDISW